MSHWIPTLAAHGAATAPAVLVTVVAAKGSTPRPPGTRMVVTAQGIDGTIGGGHLEWKAIAIAREMIGGAGTAVHRFPLGASLGQCCGGAVQLLFEPVPADAPWLAALARARADGHDCALVTAVRGEADGSRLVVTATQQWGTLGAAARDERAVALARAALAGREASRLATLGDAAAAEAGTQYFIDVVCQPDFRVVLFGAGHVGRALVNVLAALSCRITWIDSRDDAFPAAVPGNVECVATDTPEAEVAAALAGAYFLVMTHSHALDEQLAAAILARADVAYFGLIGSVSKRRQFERRLEARGMPRARLTAMRCPIGIAGIAGKEPEVIAIAVAAEILQVRYGSGVAQALQPARRA